MYRYTAEYRDYVYKEDIISGLFGFPTYLFIHNIIFTRSATSLSACPSLYIHTLNMNHNISSMTGEGEEALSS